MYDRNLANALGYGDISSTNNPKPRQRNPWSNWRDQEGQLNSGFGELAPSSENGPTDYSAGGYQPAQPQRRPMWGNQQSNNLNNALTKQPMGGIYNIQPRSMGPLQQTGFQKRFFNPTGTDTQTQTTQQPQQTPTQENLANAITKQGRGFTNAQGSWGNFNYTPGNVGQFTNQLEGFDLNKLNPDHADNNTMKYIFATAASNVDVNDPDAGAKVVAELNKMGINATLEGPYGDRIKFPTGESVDVIRNSGRVGGDPNATLGWQWIDAAYDGQPAEGGLMNDPLQQALLGGNFDPTTLMDPSNPILAQIMAILSQQNAVR